MSHFRMAGEGDETGEVHGHLLNKSCSIQLAHRTDRSGGEAPERDVSGPVNSFQLMAAPGGVRQGENMCTNDCCVGP